jgi:hypothetical protein
VRYPMAVDHPLVGKFLPDIPLATGRVAELMRAGRPVLLDFTGAATDAAAGWSDRVDVLAVDSPAPPAAAVLVRPDGYVAWAGSGQDGALTALHRWFGPPAPGL